MTEMIYVDFEDQEYKLRSIVDILHATPALGRGEAAHYRTLVAQASASYRGAVVALVMEGKLDYEQGQELNAIVDRILAEQGPE